MKYISVIILAFTVFSCSQWRVSSLKPEKFYTIKRGPSAGMVELKDDDYALRELTFRVKVTNGKIILADNLKKRLQVLDSDGTPDVIIGDVKKLKDPKKKLNLVEFNFSVIGSVTMDSDGKIYVQNRLNKRGVGRTSEGLNFSPSYILVFDKKGKLLYTLGKNGTPDLPFYYIERTEIDKYNRLLVISRSFNSWNIYRFTNKKRDVNLDLGKIPFSQKEGKETYKGTIENVRMFKNGNILLISVAYYHKLRLKYRKVFEYNINDKKLGREVITIPDPKNVLFDIIDDKYIYFWNMENRNVKFMVCNLEGSILTNILLEIKSKRSLYTNILSDDNKIYSYHVHRKGIDIIEWK